MLIPQQRRHLGAALLHGGEIIVRLIIPLLRSAVLRDLEGGLAIVNAARGPEAGVGLVFQHLRNLRAAFEGGLHERGKSIIVLDVRFRPALQKHTYQFFFFGQHKRGNSICVLRIGVAPPFQQSLRHLRVVVKGGCDHRRGPRIVLRVGERYIRSL